MIATRRLNEYYLDFSEDFQDIAHGKYGPLDAKGIPQIDYDQWYRMNRVSKPGVCYGIHYAPVLIAHYGFCIYSRILAHREEETGLFLSLADWFVENLHETGKGFGVWQHHFEVPVYQLHPPWVSAMAQGEGLSVLLRAYELSKDEVYLSTADLAFNSFKYGIPEGGVQCRDVNGDLWFEEYPSSPPCHVLNGFIFALFGLWDYFLVTECTEAKMLWEEGLRTLVNNLHKYDCGYWTVYDQGTKHVVGTKYHDLHVRQMKALSALSGDEIFAHYYQQWSAYKASWLSQLKRVVKPRMRKDYLVRHWKGVSSRIYA